MSIVAQNRQSEQKPADALAVLFGHLSEIVANVHNPITVCAMVGLRVELSIKNNAYSEAEIIKIYQEAPGFIAHAQRDTRYEVRAAYAEAIGQITNACGRIQYTLTGGRYTAPVVDPVLNSAQGNAAPEICDLVDTPAIQTKLADHATIEGRVSVSPLPDSGRRSRSANPTIPPAFENSHYCESLIDPEILRLAIAQDLMSEFALWAIAQDMIRTGAPGAESGRVSKKALFDRLPAYGIKWRQAYRYQLIKAGLGLFWRSVAGDWLYINGQRNVAALLAKRAIAAGKRELVEYDRPGVHRAYIQLHGRLQEVQSRGYAAWLVMDNGKTISRPLLEALWNRSKPVLIEWEKLAGIETQENYGQTANPQDARIPDHAQPAQFRVSAAQTVIGASWQRPNSYYVRQVIRQHPKKGQARKVRAAVNDVCEPDSPFISGEGANGNVRNFRPGSKESATRRYQRAVRKNPDRTTLDYVHIGERGRRRFDGYRPAVWELKLPVGHPDYVDWCQTTVDHYKTYPRVF